MPVSDAIFAASFRSAAPSARAIAPEPTITIGRLASFRTFRESVAAVGDRLQRVDAGAELLDRIGQIDRRTDIGDLQRAGQPCLADARIQHRRFPARIAADQQDRIRRFDTGDGRVEQIGLARTAELRAVLAAIQIGDAERRHQILERLDLFGGGQIADDGGHLLRLGRRHARGDRGERFAPRRGLQLAVLADIGPVETLAHQAVTGMARLVAKSIPR